MGKNFIAYGAKMAGNALLHVVLGLSYLVPRNREKWLVGNAKGFNNNTKYFFIHTKEVLHKEQCYWISKSRKSREEVRRLGYKAYHPWSLKGMWHELTAGVYIYDMRLSSFNYWISGRARRVNLWHGVGIKNIEFKRVVNAEKTDTLANYLRYPISYAKPHLFLSTSPLMTTHFAACFRIPESRCIESEYPRCAIFKKSREELRSFIRTYESPETSVLADRMEAASRVYIYMPTFREKNKNFLESVGFDLSALEAVLARRNELFIFKLHPFTPVKADTGRYRHILFMDNKMDIYPLLPFTDVLITDYSSIYYDYLLIPGKEILLFPFDYREYIEKDRDLAFPFDEYTPGERVNTFSELLQAIDEGRHFANERIEWVKDQFWKSPHPVDLYEAISSRL